MQTFLPYKDFYRSASVLDDKRLGKQRVEVLQILRACKGYSKGWRNHPAVRMWKGSEDHLVYYGICICEEWKRRGYNDTCEYKIRRFLGKYQRFKTESLAIWLSQSIAQKDIEWITPSFCRAHRSNLLRKYPEYYRQYWPKLCDDLSYIWPK